MFKCPIHSKLFTLWLMAKNEKKNSNKSFKMLCQYTQTYSHLQSVDWYLPCTFRHTQTKYCLESITTCYLLFVRSSEVLFIPSLPESSFWLAPDPIRLQSAVVQSLHVYIHDAHIVLSPCYRTFNKASSTEESVLCLKQLPIYLSVPATPSLFMSLALSGWQTLIQCSCWQQ